MADPTHYQDISLNFILDSNGDVGVLNDEDAVRASVKNIVLTSIGEKHFNHRFGTTLRRKFFETINWSVAFEIGQTITVALENDEPRIRKTNVRVEFRPEQHLFIANIKYVIYGAAKQVLQSIVLQRGR